MTRIEQIIIDMTSFRNEADRSPDKCTAVHEDQFGHWMKELTALTAPPVEVELPTSEGLWWSWLSGSKHWTVRRITMRDGALGFSEGLRWMQCRPGKWIPASPPAPPAATVQDGETPEAKKEQS